MISQPQIDPPEQGAQKLQSVLNIYKEVGKTPLEVLDLIRQKMPQYKDATLTYAGRLDPLADGVLLVIANDEIKNKENYMHLDKVYEVEILFGFETDTYDVMGIIQETNVLMQSEVTENNINEKLKNCIGTVTQSYPPYSSKAVNGIPLFQYAREGTLDTIEIPKRKVTIYSAELNSIRTLLPGYLLKIIKEKITLVKGDFRQLEIIRLWEQNLKTADILEHEYVVLKLTVACSEGTYMRTFAHELGKKIGVPACALSITRVKAGEYIIEDSLHL